MNPDSGPERKMSPELIQSINENLADLRDKWNAAEKRADSALSSLQSKEREIEKLQRELDRETTAHFVTIDQRDSSASLVRKLAQALSLLFTVLETYGSISPCPFESSTDHAKQITTYRCYGCAATGIASWPVWKVEFTHAPNCKWTEAESLLSDPAVENILKT